MSRAKLYVNIQKLIAAGNRPRADDLRRLIPATEVTVVNLDRLGEAFGIELSRCVPGFFWPPNQARSASAKKP